MNVHYSWDISILFAAGLLALAIVVLASVLIATRGRQFSAAKVALAFVAVLWLVPIVAILGLLGLRTVRYVDQQQVREQQVNRLRQIGQQMHQEQSDRAAERLVPQTGEVQLTPAGVTVAVPKSDGVPIQAVEQPIAEAVPGDASKLPEWVNEKSLMVNDKQLIVLTSQQFATVQEADDQVIGLARQAVTDDMKRAYSYEGQPPMTNRDIESKAFGRRHVEQIDRKSGTNTFTVYRVYRQLELSPALRSALEPQWRDQIASKRLGVLGTFAGMMTLTLAIAAGYFRIDARTGSAYRGRLRVAAVCLIAAGGLAAMSVIG